MHVLIFLCALVASVLAVENDFHSAGNGTFLTSDYFLDHSPVRALLDASHMLHGLVTRQTGGGCVDAGYAQCPGYDACCPAGGGCCSTLSLVSYVPETVLTALTSFPQSETVIRT
jgi:hypothetical protein